jgi:hypothetical protein
MRLHIFLVAAICAASVAPALAAPNAMNNMTNMMSKHSLTINIGPENGSGQSGQAFVKDTPGGLSVKVQLKGEPPSSSEPAHIHDGTCAKLDPTPWKVLSNVVDGSSVTTVPGVTVAELKKGKYAINVHKSVKAIAHYVACGDL